MRKRGLVIAVAATFGASSLVAQGAMAADDQTGKSTLQQTIRLSGSGFKQLVKGPGEKFHVRKGIGKPVKKRAKRRTSMLFFGQLTDPQLADEMSPARLELADPADGSISAAWRPQEALGARVFDSIVRNMNANRTSAVRDKRGKRAKLQFGILTGDIADSQQFNEVNWFRDLLEGGTVDPYSGQKISADNPCSATPAQVAQINSDVANRRYVGVQNFDDYPGQNSSYPGFWDPDVGGSSNKYGYGSFPKYPNLMDVAQTPINTAGLKVPWFITRGNHDSLVQGNVPANKVLDVGGIKLGLGDIAVGCLKPWPNNIFDPDKLIGVPSEDVFDKLVTDPQLRAGVIYGLLNLRKVPPDPNRRFVSKLNFKQLMGTEDNTHGFGYVNAKQNDASRGNASYYGFNRGKFRVIMLDTNAEGGGASGNLDDPQYRWLQQQLDKFSSVRITKGKVRRDNDKNKLIILSSHHTIGTLDNPTPDEAAGECTDPLKPGCDSDPRNSEPIHQGTKGERTILNLLLSYPNVVAYVNGHTHHNAIKAYKRPKSWPFRSGFWQINTASHVDFPQQSRVIEFMDNHDKTLSIFGTILNSAAPITAPKPGTDAKKMTNAQLAAVSRRLAANDPQFRDVTDGGGTGKASDRNVEMLIKDPRTLWRKAKPTDGLG